MKFKLERHGIEITPETPADEAYIEDTLGLKNNGDAVPMVRIGCLGSFQMAHLRTPSVFDRQKWVCEKRLETVNVVPPQTAPWMAVPHGPPDPQVVELIDPAPPSKSDPKGSP